MAAVFLVIGVAVGFYYGQFYAQNKTSQPSGQTPPAQNVVGISIDETPIVYADKFFQIYGDYPQFAEYPAMSGQIKDFVTTNLDEFKKSSQENFAAREATLPAGEAKKDFPDTPFYFSASWQPAQINSKDISIVVRIDYYNGGANDFMFLQTFNYNTKDNKQVALADFFPNKTDYLQKVSAYARKQLAQKLAADGITADNPILVSGTEPKTENFQNFTFTDSLITFYWPKAYVAPGAWGEQSVDLPISQIPSL